jgi:hypothetical protein
VYDEHQRAEEQDEVGDAEDERGDPVARGPGEPPRRGLDEPPHGQPEEPDDQDPQQQVAVRLGGDGLDRPRRRSACCRDLDEARDDILAFTGFPARSGARSGPTTRRLSPALTTGSSGQGIAVKNDRIHGKAVTSIEALGVVVGGKAVTEALWAPFFSAQLGNAVINCSPAPRFR